MECQHFNSLSWCLSESPAWQQPAGKPSLQEPQGQPAWLRQQQPHPPWPGGGGGVGKADRLEERWDPRLVLWAHLSLQLTIQ